MEMKLAVLIVLSLVQLSFCNSPLRFQVLSNSQSQVKGQKVSDAVTPIVLWHGMGDSCCNPLSLGSVMKFIQQQIPNVYILSIRMGNNIVEDTLSGYLMNANDQIKTACDVLAKDANLANGFHAIGFSQGGQFLRAVAQRCPQPKMINLLTLGGQHQGVFGLPNCPGISSALCEQIRKLLNTAVYTSAVQNKLVQAEYWHDPLNEEVYRTASVFLADINNEKTQNPTYRTNLMQLNKFVMVRFENDTMVQPLESEWFGFYAPGQDQVIVPLRNSTLYLDDRLGLKSMDQAGKLVFLSCPGEHLQFTEDWFVANLIPYLK